MAYRAWGWGGFWFLSAEEQINLAVKISFPIRARRGPVWKVSNSTILALARTLYLKHTGWLGNVRWLISIIPALGKLRQEDQAFMASHGYMISCPAPPPKKTQNKTKQKNPIITKRKCKCWFTPGKNTFSINMGVGVAQNILIVMCINITKKCMSLKTGRAHAATLPS